jgi:peptidoglycan biosynthesis protein MviN/MurJ (putative lipid II flippase)
MSGAARMIRNIMTLGIWTLVSRGAGLARDLMMANYLGAGAVADAFNVAFSLPNMFRRFFAEGAFNQAFVPIYAKKLEAGEDAEGFAQDAFAGLSAILLALVLIVQVFPLAALSILPTAVVTLEPADGQTKELKVSVRTDVSVR